MTTAVCKKHDPPIGALRRILHSCELCRVLFACQAKRSAFLQYRDSVKEGLNLLAAKGYTVANCTRLCNAMTRQVVDLRALGYTEVEPSATVECTHFTQKMSMKVDDQNDCEEEGRLQL